MSEIREQVDDAITIEGGADREQAKQVLRNPRFLSLFGSQILTQVGGNAVLFGLTVTVFGLTDSSTAVSVLLLTFLVPAVVFGAVAGVFVDMFDRRQILVWSNFLRAGLYLLLLIFPDQLLVIYIVTALVATLTTFFGPAEAAIRPGAAVALSELAGLSRCSSRTTCAPGKSFSNRRMLPTSAPRQP